MSDVMRLMIQRVILTTVKIHSFISGMHHYQCVAPDIDVNLQSGRFWATSVASFRERLIDFRFCWVVFIHIVQGRPGGLLQFSKGEAVKICLVSDSSGIHAMWPSRKSRQDWKHFYSVTFLISAAGFRHRLWFIQTIWHYTNLVLLLLLLVFLLLLLLNTAEWMNE